MTSSGNRFDADDPGVKSIGVSELGDVLFENGWVLCERVFEFEGVVLVLLYCEGHVYEEVVYRLHEPDVMDVSCVEPICNVVKFAV